MVVVATRMLRSLKRWAISGGKRDQGQHGHLDDLDELFPDSVLFPRSFLFARA